MSMGTKVFAASGSHDQDCCYTHIFMKPTQVDNQSVISATATALFTATAATDKLKTLTVATLTTSTAATLTRANVASLTM